MVVVLVEAVVLVVVDGAASSDASAAPDSPLPPTAGVVGDGAHPTPPGAQPAPCAVGAALVLEVVVGVAFVAVGAVVVVIAVAVAVVVVVVKHWDAHGPEQSEQLHPSPAVKVWSPLKPMKASSPIAHAGPRHWMATTEAGLEVLSKL
jgi:hypothetical protein